MSGQLHYVRHRGQVSGPFEWVELQRMVRQGVLSRIHQVSSDGKAWLAAGKYGDLFAGSMNLGGPPDLKAGEIPLELTPSAPPPRPAQGLAALAAAVQSPRRPAPVVSNDSQASILWGLGALIVGVAVTGIAIVAYMKAPPTPPQISTPTATNSTPSPSPVTPAAQAVSSAPAPDAIPAKPVSTPGLQGVIAGIADEAMISHAVGLVVSGATLSRRGGHTSEMPAAEGSCFAITGDGYLLTNRHVIKEVQDRLADTTLADEPLRRRGIEIRPRVWVFFAGQKFDADIVHSSTTWDLAVLKVTRDQPFFKLSAKKRAPRNEDVFAIGFPGIAMQPLSGSEMRKQMADESQLHADLTDYFKPRDFEFTLTRGVLGRTFSESGGSNWIQHEAILRHGNSGGPLVNKAGVVLGINTRLQTSKEDVQTNLSLEISQLREEIDSHAPGTSWE